jgi:quercetin dioxygenase-like cupin family protein
MRGVRFRFHKTEMVVLLTTADTGGAYCLIEMAHPPGVGPAQHIHPDGPESFYVLAGSYQFERAGERIDLTAGQAVSIPAGVPHRYTVGPDGGRLLVTSPKELEHYFWEVGQRLAGVGVSRDEEFAIALKYGQRFVDDSPHWGHR